MVLQRSELPSLWSGRKIVKIWRRHTAAFKIRVARQALAGPQDDNSIGQLSQD